MKPAIVLAALLLAPGCEAKPNIKKGLLTVIEHVSLGAGTQAAVSYTANAQHPNWQAGLVGVGIMAAVKEGSDVVSGRDTKKQAAVHALTILAGAGVVATVEAKH